MFHIENKTSKYYTILYKKIGDNDNSIMTTQSYSIPTHLNTYNGRIVSPLLCMSVMDV